MSTLVRYSEAFKLHVLRELEQGRFESRAAAARAYGIGGSVTIENWARKYSKEHLRGKVVRVERAKEISETKALRKRVKDLEKALADAHLEHRFDGAYLTIACQAAGIEDIEEFKKNTLVGGERRGGRRRARRGFFGQGVVRLRGDESAELLRSSAIASAPRGG